MKFWLKHKEFFKLCGVIYGITFVLCLGFLLLGGPPGITVVQAIYGVASVLGMAASISLFAYFLGNW